MRRRTEGRMRGARVGVGLLLAAEIGAAAWFFLFSGGGAPTGGGEEDAAEAAGADPAAAPSLAGRGKAPEAATRLADFRVKGKVVDAAGKPVAGVRVVARRTGAAWDQEDPTTWGDTGVVAFKKGLERVESPKTEESKPDVEGTSGPAGEFDLALKEAGNHEVKAVPAPPLLGFPTQVALSVAKPTATVSLFVSAGTLLRVRVVDAQDKPVAAVLEGWWTVKDRSRWWSAPRRRTDAAGEVAWEGVPDGTGSLSLVVPGRGSYGGVEVRTPKDGVLVVRLGPFGVVKGKVVDAEGKPVAAADVVISTGK